MASLGIVGLGIILARLWLSSDSVKELLLVEESRSMTIVLDVEVASTDKPINVPEDTDEVANDSPKGDKIGDGFVDGNKGSSDNLDFE